MCAAHNKYGQRTYGRVRSPGVTSSKCGRPHTVKLVEGEGLGRRQGLMGPRRGIASGLGTADDDRCFDGLPGLLCGPFLNAACPVADCNMRQMERHHGPGVVLGDAVHMHGKGLHTQRRTYNSEHR